MNLEFVKQQRGLHFIEKGMRVELSYGEKRPNNCHPTWGMKYFDKDGNVIAEYAGD